jgi:hypothetical protein
VPFVIAGAAVFARRAGPRRSVSGGLESLDSSDVPFPLTLTSLAGAGFALAARFAATLAILRDTIETNCA